MKFNRITKSACLVAAISGLTLGLNAQSTFNIPGDDGFVNAFSVTASGSVSFSGNTIDLFIQNGPTPDSTIASVYLLNPLAGPEPTDLLSDSLESPAPPWTLSTDLYVPAAAGNPGTILNFGSNFPNVSGTDYIGAYLASASDATSFGIHAGEGVTFSFTFDIPFFDSLDPLENGYGTDPEKPAVVVRWRQIGSQDGSAAGYGWLTDDPTTTPVPEPRLIAPLAVLGLGGLLYARRRMKAKAKK